MMSTPRNLFARFVVLFAAPLLLWGCSNGGVKEVFSLAWVDTKQQIHVRYSEDGLAWKDAKFPATVKTVVGPGMSTDPKGLMYLLVGQAGNGDRVGVFGLGPDGYTLRPPDVLAKQSAGSMSTAASVASTSMERWYLAYRDGKTAKLSYLERKGIPNKNNAFSNTWKDETPLLNVNNTYVQGRPSISIRGSRAVMSWYRQSPGVKAGELQVVVGDVQANGSIKWLGGLIFPNKEPGGQPVESEHDLSHDGKHFYLGITRYDRSTALKHYRLYIYRSPDGTKWQLHTTLGDDTAGSAFRHASPLGIAVNSKGIIMAAEFAAGFARVWRFDKTWSKPSTTVVPGLPDTKKHVSLISTVPQ